VLFVVVYFVHFVLIDQSLTWKESRTTNWKTLSYFVLTAQSLT
jgi:hypothetical protein